jgi:CheY-like chemotaxis protein
LSRIQRIYPQGSEGNMGRKILVVDDDSMNRMMAEMMLGKGGYEVTSVEGGQQCLDILGREVFDLVLLDIEMPVMSGVDTLRAIRGDERLKDNKVMLLTGTIDTPEVSEAMSLGAVGCQSKPFIPKELLEHVAQAVGE